MDSLSGYRHRLFQNAVDPKHPLASLSRWPRWLLACAIGRPIQVRFDTGGLRMWLKPQVMGFGSTSIYIKRDHYEPELLAVGRLIPPGAIVLDIGASFGAFSLFMAHFAGPEGKVYSFEPGRFSFEQLSRNIVLNAMGERIMAHNIAASDRESTVRLHHLGDSPVNFSVGSGDAGSFEEVQAARVDMVVPSCDHDRVAFIKIDVEGYERTALEGMRAILEAAHPAIMFEVSGAALARQSMTPADMYAYLASYGYRFWIWNGGRMTPIDEPRDGNIFAAVHDIG